VNFIPQEKKMTATTQNIEEMTLNITQEIHVRAPLETTLAGRPLVPRPRGQQRAFLGDRASY
jgi:F0F1-type ATP synthase alpha subunit